MRDRIRPQWGRIWGGTPKVRVLEVNDLAETALWIQGRGILLVDATMSEPERSWLASLLPD